MFRAHADSLCVACVNQKFFTKVVDHSLFKGYDEDSELLGIVLVNSLPPVWENRNREMRKWSIRTKL